VRVAHIFCAFTPFVALRFGNVVFVANKAYWNEYPEIARILNCSWSGNLDNSDLAWRKTGTFGSASFDCARNSW
jgi:hypothetical protein